LPYKSDKSSDKDYFILTLFLLAKESAQCQGGFNLNGKDVVLGVGVSACRISAQQRQHGFKRYFMG
jgi:hypothetical protein